MAEIVERKESTFGGIFRLLFVLVELLLAAMVLILGTAFVLSLFGANPDADFAAWIYARTDSIMTPFNGLFDPITLSDGNTIHVSLLFAMAVYTVIGMIIEGIARRL